MYSIRCRCGKIVCQITDTEELPRTGLAPKVPDGPVALILCRHCKTYVALEVPAVTSVSYTSTPQYLQQRPTACV